MDVRRLKVKNANLRHLSSMSYERDKVSEKLPKYTEVGLSIVVFQNSLCLGHVQLSLPVPVAAQS